MGELIWQKGPGDLAVPAGLGPAHPAAGSRNRVQVTTADSHLRIRAASETRANHGG